MEKMTGPALRFRKYSGNERCVRQGDRHAREVLVASVALAPFEAADPCVFADAH
jgi:hypothetical protein